MRIYNLCKFNPNRMISSRGIEGPFYQTIKSVSVLQNDISFVRKDSKHTL